MAVAAEGLAAISKRIEWASSSGTGHGSVSGGVSLRGNCRRLRARWLRQAWVQAFWLRLWQGGRPQSAMRGRSFDCGFAVCGDRNGISDWRADYPQRTVAGGSVCESFRSAGMDERRDFSGAGPGSADVGRGGRARAEHALRQSEERLTFALDAGGGVGTWDWEIPGSRVYAGRNFARIFSLGVNEGSEPDTALEMFVESVAPEDRARWNDGCGKRSEGRRFCGGVSAGIGGEARWVYAKGRCHFDERGKPTRFSGVVFDITARKESEAAPAPAVPDLRHGAFTHAGFQLYFRPERPV